MPVHYCVAQCDHSLKALIDWSTKQGGLVFKVRVVPRASKSKVVGEHDGALKVRVAAPPVDGAANEELIRTLADAFNVARNAVEILSGHTGKIKQVRIAGIDSSLLMSFQNTEV